MKSKSDQQARATKAGPRGRVESGEHRVDAKVTIKKSARLAKVAKVEESERAAEANAKFQAMFTQSTQFAGILSLDGTLMEANRISVEACGFSREGTIGELFWACGWWNRSMDNPAATLSPSGERVLAPSIPGAQKQPADKLSLS